jgi:hypothetical protein
LSWTFVFTDYNDFVLKDVTLSNIVVNTADLMEEAPELLAGRHVMMGAGDWLSLDCPVVPPTTKQDDSNDDEDDQDDDTHERQQRLPADGKFDIVLAAETLYTESARRLFCWLGICDPNPAWP